MKPAWKKYLLYGSLIIVVVALILTGYSAAWTGFGDYALPNGDFMRGKTLWDWMELLIIPLVLAIGAFYLQRSERAVERKAADDRARLERELATDRQQEAALQAYLDRMAELLLKEKLGESENERVLKVKRVRTLTVMRGLNAVRNGIVLRFLRDIGLFGKQESNFFVNANLQGADLEGCDLQNANLKGANLTDANLQDADLGDVNLQGADLSNTNLQGAKLGNANLQGAKLEGANLQGAWIVDTNLKDAKVSNAQLATAESLEGTTMPDGTIHE